MRPVPLFGAPAPLSSRNRRPAGTFPAAALAGDAEEIRAMADYAARFNLAYFSGTFRGDDPSWTEDPAYALWKSHPESAFGDYMRQVIAGDSGSSLRLELPPPVPGP